MKKKQYLLALIFIILMVGLAELLGENEIIFPEVLALALGAWVAEKQPWKVSRIELFCLMTLSSVVGVCIVRYANISAIAQVIIGFIFTAVTLTITKTTIVPMISACILPILLGTTSWVYPISVGALCGIIGIVQHIMEKRGVREKRELVKSEDFDLKDEMFKWGKLLVVIIFFAYFPVKSGNVFYVAPPLIVAFVELYDACGHARKNVEKVFAVILIGAWLGVGVRMLFCVYLGWPLWVAAGLTTIGLFYSFEKFKFIFPPAGAVAILPMLLPQEIIGWYPVQVTVGSVIFIAVALLFFKDTTTKEQCKVEATN